MATLSFVPTPSALDTSTGSFHFLPFMANSPPNPPMPPRTLGVKVLLAWWRMRCLAAFATAISTPASAYFMGELLRPFPWFSGTPESRSLKRARRPPAATARAQSKRMEQSLPADQARVQQGTGISQETFANLPRFPGIRTDIQRHVNHHRCADDVIARDATPEAAVIRIAAVVAHHEVTVVGDLVSGMQFIGLGTTDGVILLELLRVDPHRPVVNLNSVARQTDDPLYIVRRIGSERRTENDDLLTTGIAPER